MLKKTLLVVLAMILLSIVVAVIFVWRFELDDYRHDLEVAIAEQTGLDVKIAGGLSLARSPHLELGASDASVRSGNTELARIKKLNITIDWKPLLNRELIVKTVRRDARDIKLQLDEEGNLILPELPDRQESVEQSETGGAGLPLKKVFIDRILVADRTVTIEHGGEQTEQ